MTSKISNDDQLLQLTREDIAFKKELLEKIDKSDKEFKSQLASLNHTMSNIAAAIQQSVRILAMLVNQGQRKECRQSTESTSTRATSNSEPHSSYQAVGYHPHNVSTNPSSQWNTFYEDKEKNESEIQNIYYTFKEFMFENFTWITLVVICFKLVLYKKSFVSLLTLKTDLFKIFNIYLSY